MSDVSFSEAIVKLPHCGSADAAAKGYCVNASLLYSASRKNAFTPPPQLGGHGRVCLREYIALGYIPSNCSDAVVSRSMNYWHSDYAIGRAAAFLGREALSKIDPAFADDAQVLARIQPL